MPAWLKRRPRPQAREVGARAAASGWRRWVAVGFLVVSVGCLSWIAYDQGRGFRFGADQRLQTLLGQYAELEKLNAGLKSELAVLERQLQIERATHKDLVRQVKELSHENAGLREDVALVQAISMAGSRVDGIKVSSVRVEPNPVPGEYSYRIVLLQTGSRSKQFLGRYQLVIDVLHNGERRGMILPAPGESGDGTYRLDFRVHQRIDGTFRIDPDAIVRSVEVRVFEGRQSQPKVMQTIKVS